MLKSRVGLTPPANFYATVYGFLSRAYPGAQLTKEWMESLPPAWDQLWRDGRNAEVVVKSTCSCDGQHITVSPAFGVEPRGAYRAPLGHPRGELFDAPELRESVPVERAKSQHARLDSQVGRLTGRAAKLGRRAGRAINNAKKAELLRLLEVERADLKERRAQTKERGERSEALRKELKVFAPPAAESAPEACTRRGPAMSGTDQAILNAITASLPGLAEKLAVGLKKGS